MGGLRLEIAKDVIIGDNLLKSYSKALGKILKSEIMRQCMARDKELLDELIPPNLIQRQSQVTIGGN